jgi:hypothetical protein
VLGRSGRAEPRLSRGAIREPLAQATIMNSHLTVGFVVVAALFVSLATTRAIGDADADSPSGQEPSTSVNSGIEGQVSIGPGCPGPAGADPDCGARLAGLTISVLDEQGRMVCQVQPDIDGYFRVALPAGTYTVRPELGPWINAREQTGVVTDGQLTQVRVNYESGIR